MRLPHDEALDRLRAQDHGVLSTVAAEGGVDAVPCVFAFDDDGYCGIPVDAVKPKSSPRLRRERNLAADPRASLLVQHWDADEWDALWWVRAGLVWQPDPEPGRLDSLAGLLEARYRQYAGRPFHRVLVFRLDSVAGWAAT